MYTVEIWWILEQENKNFLFIKCYTSMFTDSFQAALLNKLQVYIGTEEPSVSDQVYI